MSFYLTIITGIMLIAERFETSNANRHLEIKKPRSKPFVVTTFYRPPNSPIELFTHLEALIGKIDSENTEHIILGDFNCNVLSQSNNNNNEALLNITDIYNPKQLIEEPTRITCNSSTLIDLIFTNYPEHVVCSGVSHISISDHSLVYAYHKLSLPSESTGTTIFSLDISKISTDKVRQ